jgi:hypothetical protein
MRYRIKAIDDGAYRELVDLLQGHVPIFVSSPKRRMLSTGDIPVSIRHQVAAHGGRITVDHQYALDARRRD